MYKSITRADRVDAGERNLLIFKGAEVAELADALDSGSSARKGVRVQIPASAPYLTWRDRSARLIRQQAVARQLYLQAMRLCAETRCRFATRIISAIPSFA